MKAITSKCFIVVLAKFLEVLEYFIFVFDCDEINFRETLQSKEDFITKRTRITPSCVLEAGFVSLEVVCFEVAFSEERRIFLNPQKLDLNSSSHESDDWADRVCCKSDQFGYLHR